MQKKYFFPQESVGSAFQKMIGKIFKILISPTYRRRNPAYFETEDAMVIRYILLQHKTGN